MFDDIGRKIKILAKIMTWVGIAISVILGIILLCSGDGILMICGGVEIVVGSIFSWVGSFLLFGFGQLITKAEVIADDMDIFLEFKLTTEEKRKANFQKHEDKTFRQQEEERVELLRQQALVKNAAKKVEIKKAISNYNTAVENNSKEIFSSSDKYIDVFCPYCGEKLSFTYAELSAGGIMECVFCNGNVDLRRFTN